MAFQAVNTTAIDIKKRTEPVIGSYVGKKEITTKIGAQVVWQFIDEDELPFGVYGFTNLNRAMEMVKVGSLCRITYRGTQKLQTKFGLKDVHQVEVAVDDGAPANGNGKEKVAAGGEMMPWDGEAE